MNLSNIRLTKICFSLCAAVALGGCTVYEGQQREHYQAYPASPYGYPAAPVYIEQGTSFYYRSDPPRRYYDDDRRRHDWDRSDRSERSRRHDDKRREPDRAAPAPAPAPRPQAKPPASTAAPVLPVPHREALRKRYSRDDEGDHFSAPRPSSDQPRTGGH